MISALCIALSAGTATLVLPTKTITLSWVHSVEQTPWEEDYTIEQNDLFLEEARIKRSGAGMDPPGEAIWRDGWWHYRPSINSLREVLLANSSFAGGYTVCWNSECHLLNTLLPAATPVRLFAADCDAKAN
jgi:hypothetical protein